MKDVMHHSPNTFVMILNTSLHGDISIGFQNKILWSSRNHEASFFHYTCWDTLVPCPVCGEAWQVAPSKVSWHRWPLPSIWSYLKGTLCGAEPHPAPAWHKRVTRYFNQFNLEDNSTNSTMFGSHLSHTKFWIVSLMMVIVASGASKMPDIFMLEHLPDSPALPGKSSPRRCKAYGDILSPHNLQRNGGNGLVSSKTCLVTVLFCDLLYIQRKWTE